jgi:IPT/TIG domain-containing protein
MALLMLRCGGGPSGPGGQPPIVLAITPADGPRIGGTSVHISGANFGAGAVVTIGGVPATDVAVESSSTISAKTGPSSPGPADVAVTVGGRTGTLPGAFNYLAVSGEPPVIASIAARGLRPNEPHNFADTGEEIIVAATVEDADTPSDQLVFQWTADAGTFSDTGASVKWQAPADVLAPTTVTLSVTVSDNTGNSANSSTTISLHDSVKEIGSLAREFLADFSDSNRDAAFVVRNFSKSARCESERDSEFSQIDDNRKLYRITSSSVGAPTVKVQFASRPCTYEPRDGDACATVPAAWDSVCVTTGSTCTPGRSDGIDHVTAVFEQSQWRLCASYYQPRGAARPSFIR